MNRFSLLSLYRSLTRHKLYATLNIGGLAVGIAVFIVLGLYVRFETSFETWVPDHDEIYVVESVWNLPQSPVNGAYPSTMGGLLEQMREDFPGIVGTRIAGGENGGVVLDGNRAVADDVAQVDAEFFDVFQLPMVEGNGKGALRDPSAAVISEKAARRYFGNQDPIGKTLTISTYKPVNYRVAGVFLDLPDNTDFKFTILIPLPAKNPEPAWYHWGSNSLATFLRFPTGQAARELEAKLPAFVDRRGRADMGENPSETLGLTLLPLTDLHLTPEGSASASRKMIAVALGLVGAITLLIALTNYVNLATAQAGLRAREVAMRKVLGADRAAVMRQFLGEALLMVGVAALLGLILAELGLPLINAAGGLALSIPYALVVPELVGLTLIAGLLAGFYPATVLSRYRPADVLASTRSPGGGRAGTRVREALVILQFSLAIAFMIGTAVLAAQTRHVREADIGFQRDGLLTVLSLRDSLVTPAQRRAFELEVSRLPAVKNVALANTTIGGSGSRSADNVPLPGVPGEGPSLMWEIVGPGFFDVYGPRLLAGRLFDDSREADDIGKSSDKQGRNIVINRQAVTALGFASAEDAVGRTVGGDRPRTIIGVVDDMRFFSPRDPVSPSYYYFTREPDTLDTSVASVRFTGDPRTVMKDIGAIWQRVVPQVPFDAKTADQRLTEFYEDDDRAARLFAIGAGLAVLIGCVGLWGLASFTTARRVKEIGIRKTLGASSSDVVKLLVGQFLRPVLIANLVAWPLAYFAMCKWLAGFADRIELSPTYFIAASLVAVLIAVLTVLGQSLRVSRTPPAWALRHD